MKKCGHDTHALYINYTMGGTVVLALRQLHESSVKGIKNGSTESEATEGMAGIERG